MITVHDVETGENGTKKVGLALSGGGFRAAAFHLGTLRKLMKLGEKYNFQIDYLSTISGGSIIGAFYSLFGPSKQTLDEFEDVLKSDLIEDSIKTGRLFPGIGVLILLIAVVYYLSSSILGTLLALIGGVIVELLYFYKIFPTTKVMIDILDTQLYKGEKLDKLSCKPMLVINSTNLDTGSLFSFTREKMWDSTYNYKHKELAKKNIKIYFDSQDISIAKAVMCSADFPYLFSPVDMKLNKEYDGKKYYFKPKLADGGIYDNQGIYRLIKEHSKFKSDIVIVSDGASPFDKEIRFSNPLPIFSRIIEVMMRRIRNYSYISSIYETKETELYQIGYYSVDWYYSNCIYGFWSAVKDNKIRKNVLLAHNIPQAIIGSKKAMVRYMVERIGYWDILKASGISRSKLNKIKMIKTNLKALSNEEIDLLSRHAETLTEIQIRLYCPSLVT